MSQLVTPCYYFIYRASRHNTEKYIMIFYCCHLNCLVFSARFLGGKGGSSDDTKPFFEPFCHSEIRSFPASLTENTEGATDMSFRGFGLSMLSLFRRRNRQTARTPALMTTTPTAAAIMIIVLVLILLGCGVLTGGIGESVGELVSLAELFEASVRNIAVLTTGAVLLATITSAVAVASAELVGVMKTCTSSEVVPHRAM